MGENNSSLTNSEFEDQLIMMTPEFLTVKVEHTEEEFQSESEPWACDTCDEEFPDFASLEKHVSRE